MTTYIIRRLSHLLLVMFGAMTIAFSMIHLVPGDPAQVIAGQFATAETVGAVRHRLGLDRPIHEQYLAYLGRLARFDLGTSYVTGTTAMHELRISFPITLRLAVFSLALAAATGIPLGILAASRRGTVVDLGTMSLAMIGLSVPNFWLGLNLILVFSVTLGWFPAFGSSTLRHYVLPTITLAAFSLALIARQTRSSMLEVLSRDYIRTAYAKGQSVRRVLYGHALKNALLPVITVIGLNFGYVLGGTIITESVFSMRGMGLLVVSAIQNRDYPLVQAVVLVIALNFALVNLIVDMTYAWIDPRIRYD